MLYKTDNRPNGPKRNLATSCDVSFLNNTIIRKVAIHLIQSIQDNLFKTFLLLNQYSIHKSLFSDKDVKDALRLTSLSVFGSKK